MNFKRNVRLALLGSLATAAFAAPAHADVNGWEMASVCTIEGSATADVDYMENRDAYNFGPTGLGIDCVYVGSDVTDVNWHGIHKAIPKTVTPIAGLAEINATSAGNFHNLLCGTGTAADQDPTVVSVTTLIDDPRAEQTFLDLDLGYHIGFVAMQGVLTWDHDSDEANGGDRHDPNTVPTRTQPVGGGYVNISPWRGPGHPLGNQGGTFPGEPPNGSCTNGFNVLGVVAGVVADVPFT